MAGGAPESDVRAGRLGAAPLVAGDDGASRRPPPRRREAERTILAVIAVAGALGALARYGLAQVVHVGPGQFPWSTFWVNVSGSGAIGVVLALVAERFPHARLARPLVVTGFLGAFTTFSTYMVDADLLFRAHAFLVGSVYTVASLLAGGAAAAVGVRLGRFLARLDGSLEERLG